MSLNIEDPRVLKDLDRFMSYVELSDPGCWLWTGYKDRAGYGRLSTTRQNKTSTHLAHRWIWLTTVDSDLGGLELDHLCFVRNCVFVDHLEPVTRRENNARIRPEMQGKYGKQRAQEVHTCPYGHPYDRINSRGHRVCSICATAATKRYRQGN